MKVIKKNKVLLIISLLYFTIVSIFIYYPIPNFQDYLPHLINHPHADWTGIVDANRCLLNGYNVYLNNPCDFGNRLYTYGRILLFLPFVNEFKFFYYNIVPNLTNFLFIFVILKIFQPAKLTEYIILFFISPITV